MVGGMSPVYIIARHNQAATMFNVRSEIDEILDSIDQSFKTFDVAYAPPNDHHFITNARPLYPPFFYPSRRLKEEYQLRMRTEQEWDILGHNLPKTIFVRAYEGRRQLMRAAIIGLPGTPYAYGLFFFDIFFPNDYPSTPPRVFHHYNHSLLDWNPTLLHNNNNNNVVVRDTSNIYHMLTFIQGSDLRLYKIYDNEDEKDLLLSHNNMLAMLKSPPMGFEDFVKGYFRKYSHAILLNFKLKGNLSECETTTKLFFELVEAFEANGSYCKHVVHGVKRVVTSSLSQQKMIKGEMSMGQLFRRALSKTNGFIMNWLCDNDAGGYGTIPYH